MRRIIFHIDASIEDAKLWGIEPGTLVAVSSDWGVFFILETDCRRTRYGDQIAGPAAAKSWIAAREGERA